MLAFIGINHRAEHCKAGEETESGPNGADAVAVGAAALKGQGYNSNQRNCSYDYGGTGYGVLYATDDSAIGPIRSKEAYYHLDPGH